MTALAADAEDLERSEGRLDVRDLCAPVGVSKKGLITSDLPGTPGTERDGPENNWGICEEELVNLGLPAPGRHPPRLPDIIICIVSKSEKRYQAKRSKSQETTTKTAEDASAMAPEQ